MRMRRGVPPTRVARLVVLTVAAIHVLAFAAGVVFLVAKVGSLHNDLAAAGRSNYAGMFLLINAHFLLAYAMISAIIFLLIHPPVRFLAVRWRLSRLVVVGLTFVLLAVFHAFFAVRLVSLYPADLGPFLNGAYASIASLISGGKWSRIPAELFDYTATVVTVPCLVYYARKVISFLIRRRLVARLAGAGTVLLALAGTTYALMPGVQGLFRNPPQKYNVLILSCDSVRGDHLSCNGYPRVTSPNMDRLASKGINFSHSFVPTASTTESWVSLMSGQYPHTHGLRTMFPSALEVHRTERASPMLPRILAGQGYKTAALGDWAGAVFNAVDMGYQEKDVSALDPQSFEMYVTEAVLTAHPLMPLYFNNEVGYAIFPNIETSIACTNSEAVTQRVIRALLRSRQRREPFMISAFYSTAHLPYGGRWPYNEKFTDPDYRGPNKYRLDFEIDSHIQDGFRSNYTPEQVRHIIDLYDGGVYEFDVNVGQIIDYMEASGMMENTIILVTSDHGECLYEPGTTIGHGSSFSGGDQNNRIPQILYLPPGLGIRPGTIDLTVRSIDMAPTLLSILGLPVPQAMDGRSLVPYITGRTDDMGLVFYGETGYSFFRERPIRDDLGRTQLTYDAMDKTLRIDPLNADRLVLKDELRSVVTRAKHREIRTEDWKLIIIPASDGGEMLQMYSTADRRNEHNLIREGRPISPQYEPIFESLYRALIRWRDQHLEARLVNGEFVYD